LLLLLIGLDSSSHCLGRTALLLLLLLLLLFRLHDCSANPQRIVFYARRDLCGIRAVLGRCCC